MLDEKKAVKMVAASDLVAIKNILRDKEKRWEVERTALTQKVSQLENVVKIAKTNGEDSAEVEAVKKMLLDQDSEVATKRVKLDEDLNSYSKREREFRARELASDLKVKGVEIEPDALLDEEDMETKSKDLLVEFQAKEIERLKTQPSGKSPESVFEDGSGGVLKKQVKDMTDAEFAAFEKHLKQGALSK